MSGTGPILLFDKSALQGLSLDESVWFDTFFYPNITPLFFVETLADLEKESSAGKTPEQVVGRLAEKTPTGGQANVYHLRLAVNDMLGRPVEMRRVPIIEGGVPVEAGNGKKGLVFKDAPEREALRRWEDGRFLDVERDFAKAWRSTLSGLNLKATYQLGKDIVARYRRPRDLSEAKALARELLEKPRSRSTRMALETFPAKEEGRRVLLERWRGAGEPPMAQFAPYAAHVMTVDLLFTIGLGADLISRERPSNKIDMAYLYYLPFCMVFVSSDRLHEHTAPLFLGKDQVFVWGPDLKTDLAKLDAHYSALPEAVKENGVMSFASRPPTDGEFLVSSLWDKLMAPTWRGEERRDRKPLSEEAEKALVARFQRMKSAPRLTGQAADFGSDDADAVMFERRVPVQRGKWRLLPPGVEKGMSSET